MTDATIPQQLRQMDAARLRRYAENLAFYGGDQWPASMTRRAEPAPRLQLREGHHRQDDVVPDLRAELRRRCGGRHARGARRARARPSARWREVYDANQLDQLDFDTEIDAAILGDGAYKVTWDAAERRVRVTAPDVQGLFAWWAGDDVSRVWRVASRYSIDAESARDDVRHRGEACRAATAALGARRRSRRPSRSSRCGRRRRFELWADGARIEERDEPVRLHPVRHLPEHPRAEAVLGRSATCRRSRSRCAS